MNTFFQSIINHGDTIIVGVVAVILGWDKVMSGSSTIRKEIAADYKERNAQLEEKIKDNADEITKTNLEVAGLKATITEKDKHIESLTKLNQDRNPETIALMKEIKNGNVAIQEFIKTTYKLISKLNKDMGYQTQILEHTRDRDKKIDKASKKHVGVPLRIPTNGKKLKVKRK